MMKNSIENSLDKIQFFYTILNNTHMYRVTHTLSKLVVDENKTGETNTQNSNNCCQWKLKMYFDRFNFMSCHT